MSISVQQLGNPPDVLQRVKSVLQDLEDQLNGQPSVFTTGGSRVPTAKVGDVLFQTSGQEVTSVNVKVGKDTLAPLNADTFGITLSSLGVSSGAEAQIRAGAISQSSLGITLTTLGVAAGAITQITAGAITLTTLGVHSGAQAQITAGAITLTTLGVAAAAQTQIAAGATTLTGASPNGLGVTTNFNTQLTTGLPSANGTLCAVVANYASGNSLLRFRGYNSGTTSNRTSFLAADGDWGFYLDTTVNFYLIMLRVGSTVYAATLV